MSNTKKISLDTIFTNAVVAGLILGFAAAASVACSANIINPSIAGLVRAAIFPMGLIGIVMTGSALFTGSVYNLMWKRQKVGRYFALLAVNWFGNLLGAIMAVQAVSLAIGDKYMNTFITIAEGKILRDPFELIMLGIFCNICVCGAIMAAKRIDGFPGKAIAIFIPVFFFVLFGFEHSIANMFYLPYGMVCGANVSIGQMFFYNLLPVTFGNLIGGWLVSFYDAWQRKLGQ